MDKLELDELRKKYSRMGDEEIRELLLAGKGEFEPEAFNLLVEEARRRQVELGAEIAASEKDEPEAQALEAELEQESYAELAVVNDRDDLAAIREKLKDSGVNFYFQPISYTGKELPVALLVQQAKADKVIGLLRDQKLKVTITLW
jgi:hypothetical protein